MKSAWANLISNVVTQQVWRTNRRTVEPACHHGGRCRNLGVSCSYQEVRESPSSPVGTADASWGARYWAANGWAKADWCSASEAVGVEVELAAHWAERLSGRSPAARQRVPW